MRLITCTLLALTTFIIGCNDAVTKKEPLDIKVSNDAPPVAETKFPVFSLATSEYPSWSTFIVAGKAKLINPSEGGEYGSLEKKWKVDVVLQVKDYDPCLTMYGGATVDAVCITNIDSLNPALGRPSTAIIPTSTSDGGDKVIAVGISTVAELKGVKTYGLSKSVSEYVFHRVIESVNLDPKDFSFNNLEPGPAATALQTGSNEVKSICVWNPFALQTLRTVKDSNVVFDSSMIPKEVIDMVVVANDSLNKTGGDKFACCVCDIFYTVCRKMDDPKTSDITYKALGEDFSNLSIEDMKLCCKDTKFYKLPEAGIELFKDKEFATTMNVVVETCKKLQILASDAPTIGFNDSSKQLNFSTKFMELVVPKAD